MDRFGNRPAFSVSNIAADAFWLGTLGVAVIAWGITLIGSLVGRFSTGIYPNFPWWSLSYIFLCIVGVVFIVGTDSISTYRVAASSALSAAFVFAASAVALLVYEPDGGKQAAGAGFILLSMVTAVWMIYFGIEPPNAGREMNAYAMHKESAISGRNSRAMRQSYRPETLNSQQPQQMYKPSTLAGFETSSPITAYPAGGLGGTGSVRSTNAFPSQASQTNLHMPPQQQISQHNLQSDANSIAGNGAITQEIAVAQPTEYPYKAKAIYGYNANPNDANEISFEKHEELEISDVSGRWWQARKANGETGIAPSNYLILL